MAAVTAEGISKQYEDTVALDEVSLSITEGTVFGLVGPNGAGKTTLVRAVTGTTEPDTGSVSVFGTTPPDVDDEQIGLLPQSFTPPKRQSARELLDYYAGLYEDARPVDEILGEVGLVEAADTRYANLSGVQQRRACVGITLVNDPDLLFLDASGTTVFLTTHYMAEAETLVDRVGLLADGRLVTTGTPTDLVDDYGGGTRLQIETAGQPPTDPEALPVAAAATETGVVVHDVDPTEIGSVLGALSDCGIEYDALSWTEPTLEDVYLSLTDAETGSKARPGPRATAGNSVPGSEASR